MTTQHNNPVTFSFRDGLFMPFMYKGHQIVVHNASWSFKEKVWIDDELVVNQNGFAMSSTHDIVVEGDTLALTFGSRNKLRDVFLEVRHGDQVIYEVSEPLSDGVNARELTAIIIGSGLGGLAVGYLAASFFGGA
ncbi:hypothetical protein [Alteromonas antoniana]|uniref:hypothetical protein n=1 Tax=Alteromonas antoniana TaxID=2803813 RepID=UPI001C4728E3|nr:hypothetical protein [Alteromonas antoniana]